MLRFLSLAAVITVCLPAGARIPSDPRVRKQAVQKVEITFDPAIVNDLNLVEVVGPDAKGNAVLRAQILLDRAHFSCGEIDGVYGINLQKAITAFQLHRVIPGNGILGPATWNVLQEDTAPALFPYTISPEDVAGPFVKIPADMMKKAKLPALNYQSPLEALGEKFHSSPKLIAKLNPEKHFVAGDQILVPNVIVMAPGKASMVVVSRLDPSVAVYDDEGKILAYYPATIGSQHDPLPIETWTIQRVSRNPWFHYNPELFWDARKGHKQAKLPPGPNSPVGVVWINLSQEHYGIHGTPEPSTIGKTQSHGCIRLTNWNARELSQMISAGTAAVLKE